MIHGASRRGDLRFSRSSRSDPLAPVSRPWVQDPTNNAVVTTSEKPAFSAADSRGGVCWYPGPTYAQLQSSCARIDKSVGVSITVEEFWGRALRVGQDGRIWGRFATLREQACSHRTKHNSLICRALWERGHPRLLL